MDPDAKHPQLAPGLAEEGSSTSNPNDGIDGALPSHHRNNPSISRTLLKVPLASEIEPKLHLLSRKAPTEDLQRYLSAHRIEVKLLTNSTELMAGVMEDSPLNQQVYARALHRHLPLIGISLQPHSLLAELLDTTAIENLLPDVQITIGNTAESHSWFLGVPKVLIFPQDLLLYPDLANLPNGQARLAELQASVVHEIEHIRTYSESEANTPSPYAGRFATKRGQSFPVGREDLESQFTLEAYSRGYCADEARCYLRGGSVVFNKYQQNGEDAFATVARNHLESAAIFAARNRVVTTQVLNQSLTMNKIANRLLGALRIKNTAIAHWQTTRPHAIFSSPFLRFDVDLPILGVTEPTTMKQLHAVFFQQMEELLKCSISDEAKIEEMLKALPPMRE